MLYILLRHFRYISCLQRPFNTPFNRKHNNTRLQNSDSRTENIIEMKASFQTTILMESSGLLSQYN